MGGSGVISRAYWAYLDDTTTFGDEAHATVKGFSCILPPHARPAQPTSIGATTWRTVSKAAPCFAVDGIATLKVIVRPKVYGALYWVKVKPVSASL
jgi:hypothetical protein